jgi:large subunit ribosomal protein L20
MVRATNGPASRQKKNRRLKLARGYRGGRSRLWRTASETLIRAWAYATRDRRQKKRDFRALWIQRVNAAARMRGISYSQLVHGLKLAGVTLNRKQLAELAIHDPGAFDAVVAEARAARAKQAV